MTDSTHQKIRKQAQAIGLERLIVRLSEHADPQIPLDHLTAVSLIQEALQAISDLIAWDETYRIEREKILKEIQGLTKRAHDLETINRQLRQSRGLPVSPR